MGPPPLDRRAKDLGPLLVAADRPHRTRQKGVRCRSAGDAGSGARVKAAHRRTGIWGSRYLVILRSAAGIAAASLHKLV